MVEDIKNPFSIDFPRAGNTSTTCSYSTDAFQALTAGSYSASRHRLRCAVSRRRRTCGSLSFEHRATPECLPLLLGFDRDYRRIRFAVRVVLGACRPCAGPCVFPLCPWSNPPLDPTLCRCLCRNSFCLTTTSTPAALSTW